MNSFGQAAKAILATVAPLIGTALGGPFGGLAGTVLSKYLGSTDAKTMETAITSGDPDILLKMKQADAEFSEHMKTLSISEESLIYADKADARAREIAVKDKTPAVLAGSVTVGFFGLLAFLCFGTPPAASLTILNIMIGALGTAWVGIINYYFGSSSGSAAKSETLAKIASAP